MPPRPKKDQPVNHENGSSETVFSTASKPPGMKKLTATRGRKPRNVPPETNHVGQVDQTEPPTLPAQCTAPAIPPTRSAAASTATAEATATIPMRRTVDFVIPTTGAFSEDEENPFFQPVTATLSNLSLDDPPDSPSATETPRPRPMPTTLAARSATEANPPITTLRFRSPMTPARFNAPVPAPLTPAQLDRLIDVAIPSSTSPRAGRHSPSHASPQVRDARKKKASREAQDINPFFEKRGAKRTCKFCLQAQNTGSKVKVSDFGSNTATGSLRTHLYSKHLDEWLQSCNKLGIKIKATDQALQNAIQDYNDRHSANNSDQDTTNSRVPVYKPFSQEAFVDAIVEWIIADDQSINAIENPQLRSIFLMLRKELCNQDIPHRTTIREKVIERWGKHLKDLERDMMNAVGKISFTADCWTDSNLSPFMAITAHWIEVKAGKPSNGKNHDVVLRCELVGFHRVPGCHTGQHLAAVFMSIIDRLHIQVEKVGWLTLDNASNNDTMMAALEELLNSRGIAFSAEDQHIRCFPHIVNLAVQSILAAVTNLDYAKDNSQDFSPEAAQRRDLIAMLRTLINKIRASSLRREQFAKIQEALFPNKITLQLIRDVSTRWSSTHLMICRALELRKAIDKYVLSNTDLYQYRLSDADWKVLEAYAKILAVPHAFQQKLSAETTPTLSAALPSFKRMLAVWTDLQKSMPSYSGIIAAGINKLSDYYSKVIDIPAFQLSILLNPKQKLRWFQENLPLSVEAAQKLLLEHLKPYTTTHEGDGSELSGRPRNGGTSAQAQAQHAPTGLTSITDAAWADNILGENEGNSSVVNQSRTLQHEVDAYLLELSPPGSTILGYWQENQHRFPTIFRLAADILAIQGSAVPCERVFSAGKETMTARRNRIKSDLMEALQMLKFSFKRGYSPNFTVGLSISEELATLESSALASTFVPEDLGSFTDSLTCGTIEDNDENISCSDIMPNSDTDH